MRLRVISITGKPRERAGFVFTNVPTTVTIGLDELYPQDTADCKARKDWPPPWKVLEERDEKTGVVTTKQVRETPTSRLKLLLADANADVLSSDDPKAWIASLENPDPEVKRGGGLYVQQVPDDYIEGSVESLNATVATVTAERDKLAARVAELEAKASGIVDGKKPAKG